MKILDISMLEKEFYLQDTTFIAKNLIGKILVRKCGNSILSGKIVETEAYLSSNDMSSHSAQGKTIRNAVMFETGGLMYVYKIYGMHHCINVVTENQDIGAAVLIRAIEPLSGIEKMIENRNTDKIDTLCKGPGNVAKAFGFDLNMNGHSFLSDDLFICNSEDNSDFVIGISKRIGITKSADLPLRFYMKDSLYISKSSNGLLKNQFHK
jgi:DNA-3-methyladenine glycosylase